MSQQTIILHYKVQLFVRESSETPKYNQGTKFDVPLDVKLMVHTVNTKL
jgi:hypothetical protein